MITQERTLETVELFGLSVVCSSEETFWRFLKADLQKKRVDKVATPKQVDLLMTPNPEQIALAEKNPEFKRNLQQATWLIPDGAGLVWASRYFYNLKLRKEKCRERIAGADIVARILNWAEEKEWSVLVVGGFYNEFVVQEEGDETKDEVNCEGNRDSKKVKLRDGQEIHWLAGYEIVTAPKKEEEIIVERVIKKLKPKIVLVAFGAPEQEKWLVEHRRLLQQNGCVLGMAIGGSVDFLTGKTTRAPEIMQKGGLEWLYRLARQPWRWRRQLALGKFLGLVAEEANQELKKLRTKN